MKSRILYVADADAARAEVEGKGGHVTLVLAPNVVVADLPDSLDPASLQSAMPEPGVELRPEESMAVDAWRSLQGTSNELAPSADDGLSWDDPDHSAPVHLHGDGGPGPDNGEAAKPGDDGPHARSTNTPTSMVLVGSVAVGIVAVSGPTPGTTFTQPELTKLFAQVQEGLQFLATAEPLARVTFAIDFQHVQVSVPPNTVASGFDEFERLEAPWRNAALEKMGFAASRAGSLQYVQSIQASKATRWAFVAYFTKYPLNHFAYAVAEKLVMDYANDNWGPDKIGRVFTHEVGHIFGAADEYGSCTVAPSGHLNVPNKNCRNVANPQMKCLMDGNVYELCPHSRLQLGWHASMFQPAAAPAA